jgi:small subunit ribosomal protein S5
MARNRREHRFQNEERPAWSPKTQLGKDVASGKYEKIDDILAKGMVILEPGIIDKLIPDMKEEVIYIGGSPGKGGGIRRTPTKKTARMHKSGRRFKLTAVIAVGNESGVIGLGTASSRESRTATEKALEQAKMNVIKVRLGCGSWECGCGGVHSIPFKMEAKYGSVRAELLPAPKGVGIVGNNACKQILRLAGIKDIWVRTLGNTGARRNLVYAVFEALKNLSRTKGDM